MKTWSGQNSDLSSEGQGKSAEENNQQQKEHKKDGIAFFDV